MRKIDAIIAGLQIFAKAADAQTSAQHDVLYGAPPDAEISDEDKAKLKEWGWHYDTIEGWSIFT